MTTTFISTPFGLRQRNVINVAPAYNLQLGEAS